MRRSSLFTLALAVFAPLVGAACTWDAAAPQGSGSATTTGGGGSGGSPLDVTTILETLPHSCAFACTGCAEPAQPFACPTVAPWDELPHDTVCGAWDGSYPTPVAGKCSATEPSDEAARKTGAFTGGLVLPDGHRITPAGQESVFHEADLQGTYPLNIAAVPGTHLALVADGGIQDNVLRLIDLDALAAGQEPVASYVPFHQPQSIYFGIAFVGGTRALVSGGGDGKIYAFDIDTTAKTLAQATDATIDMGLGEFNLAYYVGPIATTSDGHKLVVAPSENSSSVRVVSLDTADYGTTTATLTVDTHAHTFFDLQRDPFDPAGATFYATDLTASAFVEIDATHGKITRQVMLGKNPSAIVFLDDKRALVSESDHDAIAVVDRALMTVEREVTLLDKSRLHGLAPSGMAYDATARRLWVALGGVNAIEAFDVSATTGAPTSVGRVPASWWPTGVLAGDDGSLVVINGKGHGTGTDGKDYTWAQGPITGLMRGSIQRVDAADLADLTAFSAAALANEDIASLAGHSEVTCPAGADDFPIPTDNTHGRSKQIKHVILVVRENKTYDALFGDLGTGDGDPSLVMAPTPDLQAKIWQNGRALAKTFANFDNFYTDAEQSIQGHTWTVFGRTTDFMERTWLTIWGRGSRPEARAISDESTPEEKGVFQWFADNNIGIDDMGEIVGGGALDTKYPGLVFTQDLPDIEKSCYMAGRIRLSCDLKPFTYAVQPDDHTDGGNAGSAAPEVMIAVNDEATGMLVDAISHSPIWKDSLVIVTEDDPQDGGDHVDQHRSVLLMISPWARRAYTSHGHYDMASVYKLVAHIFAIPYHNEMIASAMLPFDAFTSTPDYTPYTFQPRVVVGPCNSLTGAESELAKRWDFEDLDDQPGLSQQIARMMKNPVERGVHIVPAPEKRAH